MRIELDAVYRVTLSREELDVVSQILNFADEWVACEPEDREGMINGHLHPWITEVSSEKILHELACEFAEPPLMEII